MTTEFRDTDLEEDDPAEVLPGDVCVVRPMNGPHSPGRLFVVTDVEDRCCCQGMLAGIETELATEVDALLAASLTGLGYEIAVYPRFSGAVWVAQISRRVGAVTRNVLGQLLALAWRDEPDGVVVPRGILLQPAGIDPRYPALVEMSAELDQLTDHWRRWHGDLAPGFDPAIARPDVLRAVASERWSLSDVSNVEVSPELMAELRTSFSQLSRDEQRALQPIFERAFSASPPTRSVGAVDEIAGHHRGQALSQVVSRAATHGPTVTVRSHRRCWRETPQRARRISIDHRPTLIEITSVNGTDLPEEL